MLHISVDCITRDKVAALQIGDRRNTLASAGAVPEEHKPGTLAASHSLQVSLTGATMKTGLQLTQGVGRGATNDGTTARTDTTGLSGFSEIPLPYFLRQVLITLLCMRLQLHWSCIRRRILSCSKVRLLWLGKIDLAW